MIDYNGLITSHPVKDKELRENLSDTANNELKIIVDKMKKRETGEGFYTYEGVKKFVRFEPTSNWVVAITANFDDYMAPAYGIRKNTLIIISIAILLVLFIALVIASLITRPIKQLKSLMGQAGSENLSVQSNIKTGDEIEDLGKSFNQMILSQAEIIQQVRASAQELAASSEEMAASASQVSSAAEQVGATMQIISKDAEQQNQSILDVSTALVQLSSLVQLAQNKALLRIRPQLSQWKTLGWAELR